MQGAAEYIKGHIRKGKIVEIQGTGVPWISRVPVGVRLRFHLRRDLDALPRTQVWHVFVVQEKGS